MAVRAAALAFFSLVAVQSLTLQSAAAAEQPEAMVRMVVRLTGPGIKANTNSALPKTIYRGGPHYARIEDPPDARQQLQKVTVIAEPDGYSVNLIDRKGTHYADSGGSNDLHLPIVLPFDPKHKFGQLDRIEFGDEYDFFEDAGAKPEPGPIINAKPTDALRLPFPTGSALLILRKDTQIPITLTWTTAEGSYRYEYIEYVEKPFDASLFKRPEGITYKEIEPDKTGEH